MSDALTQRFFMATKEKMWRGQFDVFAAPLRVVGIDLAEYTLDLEVDQYLAHIPMLARKATTPELQLTELRRAHLYAEPTELPVPADERVDVLVLYQEDEFDETSPLICLVNEGRGLPLVGNGVPVSVTWSAVGVAALD